MEAHEKGLLHRAFSIFIFNDEGHMLIHQRAKTKYHCGGLWTNACCSHPRQNETILQAANRRLMEEMGMQCPLQEVFSFVYRAEVDKNLVEHEFDHVLFGTYNGNSITPNPEEVESFRWIAIADLQKEVQETPHHFTPWFLIVLPRILDGS